MLRSTRLPGLTSSGTELVQRPRTFWLSSIPGRLFPTFALIMFWNSCKPPTKQVVNNNSTFFRNLGSSLFQLTSHHHHGEIRRSPLHIVVPTEISQTGCEIELRIREIALDLHYNNTNILTSVSGQPLIVSYCKKRWGG